MRKTLLTASIITLTVAIVPACATKGFVREEVGAVNTKVDTLGGTVEQAQQRIGQNETRIGAVDQKAEAAGKAAAAAQPVRPKPVLRQRAARLTRLRLPRRPSVDESMRVVAASRRLIYEVTLSEDQGNFKFGSCGLPR